MVYLLSKQCSARLNKSIRMFWLCRPLSALSYMLTNEGSCLALLIGEKHEQNHICSMGESPIMLLKTLRSSHITPLPSVDL